MSDQTEESIPEELAESGEKSGVQEEIDDEIPQEPFNPKAFLHPGDKKIWLVKKCAHKSDKQ
jgi:hypothetical protein